MADDLSLGSRAANGDLRILNRGEELVIHLRAGDALVRIGGGGTAGLISLRDSSSGSGQETIRLSGAAGDLLLRDGETRTVIHLSARNGVVRIGGGSASGESGPEGEIQVRDGGGQTPLHLRARDALVRVGGGGTAGVVTVRDDSSGSGRETVRIDGAAGDIVLQNADFAEEFQAAAPLEPGTVAVLGEDGAVAASACAYDNRVVGVISGAGDYRPGIVLDRQADDPNRLPVAMVGKVFCKVDATRCPIGVGDLLTTAAMPGHAMKAADPTRSFGAVIGKALSSIGEGTGLLPIVVALQ